MLFTCTVIFAHTHGVEGFFYQTRPCRENVPDTYFEKNKGKKNSILHLATQVGWPTSARQRHMKYRPLQDMEGTITFHFCKNQGAHPWSFLLTS